MNRISLGKDLYVKGRIGWRGLNKDEYLNKSDYKIINGTALMDGYIDWNKCGYISKERYDESPEIMLKEDDILITKDGTIGKIGYVKNLACKCSVASGIFVVRNTKKDILDTDYLYHLLNSHVFKDFVFRNKAEGSTINHLYQRELDKFVIELPDLKEQKKVASILNKIDDIMTNNVYINNTITNSIKEKYDFIFYNLDNKYTDLVFSKELNRKIRKCWKVVKLDNVLKKITKNKQYKTSEYLEDGKYPIIDQSVDYICGFCNEKENLLNLDDCVIFGDHTRELKYVNFPFARGADGTKVLYSNEKNLNNYLMYLQLYDYDISNQGYSRYYKYLKEKYVFIPDDETVGLFNQGIMQQMNVIRENIEFNITLGRLKRYILPLLMNGQIKIED